MRVTLIISLVSLLLSLLVGEVYLRMVGFTPKAVWVNANFDGSNWGMEDPVLGWVNRSGTFASLEKGGADMSFQPDHTRTSRPVAEAGRSADVLVVGCSFTQGYSVSDAETYAWRLGERFPGLIIDNFGTGGYSTYQSLLRIRNELQARKDPPKLVILGFIAHQMVRTVAPPDWVKYLTDRNGSMVIPPHATVDGGRLVDHPLETVEPWPFEHRSALVTELHAGVLRLRLGDRMAQRVSATAAVIRSMRDLIEARGGRLLVALLDDASLPGGKSDYDGLVATLGAAKVAYVDCVDPDYDANPSALQVGGAGHPNGTVHRRWADCIGRWVEANLPGDGVATPPRPVP
ncbi:SGNH/GDSL hydrolase family protein [Azospirillum sp.]|uniref:SGNH/GDSL hydrolase family protein n=1 Tax=Azospirillum sp. TaxID=34012 RepID=UPI002617838D|nr:SGNH/GDSL hydrolase family protein [Azospirillum sp.]